MNIYTRAIFFKNGDTLTITEVEMRAIQDAILQGNRWIMVQGEMISADTIARIGSHHATVEMAIREEANQKRELAILGIADKEDDNKTIDIQTANSRHTFSQEELLAKTKEFRSGLKDVLHWRDENEELHYS